MTVFASLRSAMVEQQSFRAVFVSARPRRHAYGPREAFLPERLREFAYDDSPLPIDADQTISQPYIVAFMIEPWNLRVERSPRDRRRIGLCSGRPFPGRRSRLHGRTHRAARGKGCLVLADLHFDNVLVCMGMVRSAGRNCSHRRDYRRCRRADSAGFPEGSVETDGRHGYSCRHRQRTQELVRVTRLSKANSGLKTSPMCACPVVGRRRLAAGRARWSLRPR